MTPDDSLSVVRFGQTARKKKLNCNFSLLTVVIYVIR